MFVAQDGTNVERERWGYCVTYTDGTLHHQFDVEKNKYNNFYSIDLDRVAKITMICFETGKEYSLDIPKGGKLIHYYDNFLQMAMNGSTTHQRAYCFGYKLGEEEKIFTILPDDTLLPGVVQ